MPANLAHPDSSPTTIVAVLAHNEERRIGACLASLPLDGPGLDVHVIVNGSRDRTAERARAAGDYEAWTPDA